MNKERIDSNDKDAVADSRLVGLLEGDRKHRSKSQMMSCAMLAATALPLCLARRSDGWLWLDAGLFGIAAVGIGVCVFIAEKR